MLQDINLFRIHAIFKGPTSHFQYLFVRKSFPFSIKPSDHPLGRFDRLIFVAPPDESAREEIFKLKLHGRFAEEIDTSALAAQTQFFSGADIETVVELASENLIEEILGTGIERPLNNEDLLQVLQNQHPSTLEWLRTAKNYVKYANQGGLYNDVEKYLRKHSRRI